MDKLSTEQRVIASVRHHRQQLREETRVFRPGDVRDAPDEFGARQRDRRKSDAYKDKEKDDGADDPLQNLSFPHFVASVVADAKTPALQALMKDLQAYAKDVGDAIYENAYHLNLDGKAVIGPLTNWILDTLEREGLRVLLGKSEGVLKVDPQTNEVTDEQIMTGKEWAAFLIAFMLADQAELEA